MKQYREYHSPFDDPNGENAATQEAPAEEGAALVNGPEAAE